jgi:cell division control protein 45
MSGTWYGQSAAGIVYILATALERVDNDLLWYARYVLSILSRCSLTKARNPWPYKSVYPLSNITY